MKKMIAIITVLLATVAVSAPIRSMVGARAVANTPTEAVQYTAKDYIQDGLIAMWDGIENARWGVHDENATVWKNLLGDEGYDFPNCASWGDKYFDLTTSYVATLNAADPKLRLITTKNFSCPSQLMAEVVYMSYKQYPNYTIIFGTIPDGNNRRILQMRTPYYSIAWVDARFGIVLNFGDGSEFNMSRNQLGWLPDWGSIHVFSWGMESSSGDNPVYLDSSRVGNVGYYRTTWAMPFTIGDQYKTTQTSAMRTSSCGRFYCIRIYSRVLDAEEVVYNYKVDKSRFNIR